MDNGQTILFQTHRGETKIEVLTDESIWSTADKIAECINGSKMI